MKKLPLFVSLVLVGVVVGWWLLRPSETTAAGIPPPPPSAAPKIVRAEPAAPRTVVPVAPAPVEVTRPIPVPGQPKPAMNDIMLPGNRIFDSRFGLMVTYPPNWTVRDVALRWGVNEGENTVFFGPPEGSKATPSMYYRNYTDGPPFDMTNPEATLRDMARQKEASRTSSGGTDYKNDPDSFVFRNIDGRPSLSYFATYTHPRTGEVHAEYFLRILGPAGYVMFFNNGPVKDVQALIPTVFEMAGTVKPP